MIRKNWKEEVVIALTKPKRYIDLQRELDILPATLSSQLKKLLDQGLIEKIYAQKEGMLKYQLTAKGWRDVYLTHFILKMKEGIKQGEIEDLEFRLSLALKTPNELEELLIEIFGKGEIDKEDIKAAINELKKRIKKEKEIPYG